MKKTSDPTPEQVAAKLFEEQLAKQVEEMIPLVKTRLGEERLAKLSGQPPCLAAGGIESILQQACEESAGHPQPVVSAAVRTLQLCGSVPTADDLKD